MDKVDKICLLVLLTTSSLMIWFSLTVDWFAFLYIIPGWSVFILGFIFTKKKSKVK